MGHGESAAGFRVLREVEAVPRGVGVGRVQHGQVILVASRKRRIATGAGVPVQEINRLLKQFEQMQKMMKQMQKGGMAKMMRSMKGMMPGMR